MSDQNISIQSPVSPSHANIMTITAAFVAWLGRLWRGQAYFLLEQQLENERNAHKAALTAIAERHKEEIERLNRQAEDTKKFLLEQINKLEARAHMLDARFETEHERLLFRHNMPIDPRAQQAAIQAKLAAQRPTPRKEPAVKRAINDVKLQQKADFINNVQAYAEKAGIQISSSTLDQYFEDQSIAEPTLSDEGDIPFDFEAYRRGA